MRRRRVGLLTGCGQEDGHLEGFAFDDLSAGARAGRAQAASNGMYTVQRSRKNEIFVGRETWQAVCP